MKRYTLSSRIKGTICAPSSKSIMIRAVALALLAEGISIIKNPSECDDAKAALDIAEIFGAGIEKKDGLLFIEGNTSLKEKPIKKSHLHCGESGLCMRMFSPVAGLLDKEIVLEGQGTLLFRPMTMVEELVKLGARCSTKDGLPPVVVRGPISSGRYTLDGSLSSQFITGVLISLPLCNGDSEIHANNLKSKPYLKMTIEMMKDFGVPCEYDEGLNTFFIKGNQRYISRKYEIEGDWSAASFMFVAGALAGEITVTGLNTHSAQADKVILNILQMAGAHIKIEDHKITVSKNTLKAFEFHAEDAPDSVPAAVALAVHCNGKTVITGIERLQFKESNRLYVLIKEFSKMGIKIYIEKDRLIIEGGKLKNAIVNSHNDHRIAMACAVCRLRGEAEVIIENPHCVSKSYPSFFQDLSRCVEER